MSSTTTTSSNTTRSLRKSSRVRRLSSKALNSDNKDQFINNIIYNTDNDIQLSSPTCSTSSQSSRNEEKEQEEPILKKRKLSSVNSFEPVNNYNIINVKIGNNEEEEDFLLNLSNNNTTGLLNLDEELRETEARISELFNNTNIEQQQMATTTTTTITSPTTTPITLESPITTTSTSTSTSSSSLEEFLNYDLMPSLTDESDLESAPEYLPQCFDYRSNHDSVNLSLIQNGVSTQKKLINAIKKRSADVFLTDGMFSHFF